MRRASASRESTLAHTAAVGRKSGMAEVRDLDTLACVWGERLSAREELPETHKGAFAEHASLAASRAKSEASRTLRIF